MNSISARDLAELMQGKKVEVIDIRETYEHQYGHVPGCKNIPMNSILSAPQNFLKKDETYYIICQSGGRSSMACQYLANAGFNVVNVLGGHGSWPGKLER